MKIFIGLTRMMECPHCKKLVGIAVARAKKIRENCYLIGELECPRPECGKIIAYLQVEALSKT